MRAIGMDNINTLSQLDIEFLREVYEKGELTATPQTCEIGLKKLSDQNLISVSYHSLDGNSIACILSTALLREIMRPSHHEKMIHVLSEIRGGNNPVPANDQSYILALEKLGFVQEVWDVTLTDDGAEFLDKFSEPSLIEMEKHRFEWSSKTFPAATSKSALSHLKSEVLEIESNLNNGIKDVTEYADALMLIMDAAGRDGFTALDVLNAFRDKHEVNKQRNWIKNEDGSYYHTK